MTLTRDSENSTLGDSHHQHRDSVSEVCIPDALRALHVQIIGTSGVGKSCLMEYLCARDIDRGRGVAVIDPHGDLAEGVMSRITEKDVNRVLYFNPAHPDLVPLLNPLAREEGLVAKIQAEDLLTVFVPLTTDLGQRLEVFMRQVFCGLIRTGAGTLADAFVLLGKESAAKKRLRLKVLEVVEDKQARHFWEREIRTYRPYDDLAHVLCRLSRLLLAKNMGVMFSQPENRFNFQDIIERGKVFIANLAGMESGVRAFLGTLLLSMLHSATLRRKDIPDDDRQFFGIYVDDADQFRTEVLEQMLHCMRRYKCSITFTHQSLSQSEQRKHVDIMGIVGATIAFNVVAEDAPQIAEFLGGHVSVKDLVALGQGEAIVRTGNDVIRLRIPSMTPVPDRSAGDRAKELCYQKYYRLASEILKSIPKSGLSKTSSTR